MVAHTLPIIRGADRDIVSPVLRKRTLPIIRGADAIALIDGGAVAELGTTRNCSRAAAGTRACGAPRGPGAENPVDQVKVIQVWF